MAALPRESKFRHIFNNVAAADQSFSDIKPDCFGEAQHIAANQKYFAVPIVAGGGGSFMVHDLSKTGRIDRSHPLVKVHTARILELAFNNFEADIIASSSDDCTVRVSKIPENMKENLTKEEVCLKGHSKKVTCLVWHPTAADVLASSSADKNVILWDVEMGEEAIRCPDHTDFVYSVVWNENGQFFGTSCQDRIVRIMDPRLDQPVVQWAEGHENKKNSKVFWLNRRNMIGSVGFTKDSSRELIFFDTRNMSKAFHRKRLDRQNSKFLPYFEDDNDLLYLSGKGDAGIRVYEVSDQEGFCHPITEIKMLDPHKGVAIMPRRTIDTTKCELIKVMRLLSSSIQPVSIMAPRRTASTVFQEDLYPDCYAGKSSMTIDEYFDGKNKDVIKVSMNKMTSAADAGGSSRFRRRNRNASVNPPEKNKPKPVPEKKKESTPPVTRQNSRMRFKARSQAESSAAGKSKQTSAATGSKETSRLEEEIASLKKTLKKRDDEVSNLKKELSGLEKTIKDLGKETANAKKKLGTKQEEVTLLKEELEEVKERLETKAGDSDEEDESEVKKMRHNLRKLKHKRKKLEKELDHAEDIINKQAQTIKNLNRKLVER